ncbi:MAG: hypothetical protein ABS79_05450 [Planctomycetes bacterium SCN 63-9]|nr:MAG: hypothetical protein ABS79_05450 [Planctomycetes bacterium SCN 63-9]
MNIPFINALLASTLCLLQLGDPQGDPDQAHVPISALAGNYHFGDGFVGHSLTVTPDGRFQSETQGCLGVYDWNSGRAEAVGGHLVLIPDRINLRRCSLFLGLAYEGFLRVLCPETDLSDEEDEGRDLIRLSADLRSFIVDLSEMASEFRSRSRTSEFIPVRWGKRLYLVPEGEGSSFCNRINLGLESRFPAYSFYLREGKGEQEIRAFPEIPRQWRSMLLKTPIRGKIIDVMAGGRARIDLGTEHGVWVGMNLESDLDGFGGSEVVEVSKDSCMIKRFDSSQPGFKYGQGVSSRRAGVDQVRSDVPIE